MGPLSEERRAARLRSLCAAILVLDVAYAAASLFVPSMPGWKMFASTETSTLEVVDREGVRVDPRTYLPGDAENLDRATLLRVVTFACLRDPGRAPYVVRDRATLGATRFSAPSCEADAPR